MTAELHNRGFHLNHKTIQRLMKQLGLICRVRAKKYRSYKGKLAELRQICCSGISMRKNQIRNG
ncbi:IS3 family transposase [Gallintestinimicrobium sp.]|uniref:IS3 family transposase n=1 Tax=Gallintestinimicrobium sp. TaxID=2981655 RepID=UPI00399A4AD5